MIRKCWSPVNELLENTDLYVEGFIDDNKQLSGRTLNGKIIYNSSNLKNN